MARAVAARSDLILMDEPGAGLDINESHDLSARLTEIARGGTAILLVDHDMSLVLETCHEISVLDFGRLIARGSPQTWSRIRPVLSAYLGNGDSPPPPPGPADAGRLTESGAAQASDRRATAHEPAQGQGAQSGYRGCR